MTPRKQRTLFVAIIILGVAVATGLVIAALGQNMLYFYSPTQIKEGKALNARSIRVGGLVVKGSVEHSPNSLAVRFRVTDKVSQIPVTYTGILPDLFGEGQGMVGTGSYVNGTFKATEILAKHDSKYMPKEVIDALKAQGVYVAPQTQPGS